MNPLDVMWVGLGGGLGSVLRWGVGRIVGERYHGDFPLSTFLINISGAFVIGYLSVLFGIDSLCCANIAPAVACQPVEASTDPDGCWHSEACHPIQHIASNLCFDLLTGQSPGEESPSNDGFVSIHCSLNEASPVVARTTLPAHATMLFDGCNMLIQYPGLHAPTRVSPSYAPSAITNATGVVT